MKLKILINYDYQYAPFTTAYYFEKALRRRGDCEVYRVGDGIDGKVDMVINFMPCERFVRRAGALTVYWEGDSHVIQGSKHELYNQADVIFHAQPTYFDRYPFSKTYVLLHAADPELHKPFPNEPKKYDVGFLGNDTYPERREFLDAIGKEFKLLRGTSEPGLPYSKKLSSCRCIFNHSYLRDINMRIFEAMSIGIPLLTDPVPHLGLVGNAGDHFFTYEDKRALFFLIRYIIDNPSVSFAMGNRAREHVIKNHTYEKRVEQMLEVISPYLKGLRG